MAVDPLIRAEAEVGRIVRSFAEPRYAPLRPTMMAALRPRKADYPLVFRGGAADVARRGYTVFWNNLPALPVKAEQTEIHAIAAWSQDLAADAPRSNAFPSLYREIASFLQPGVIWAVCELHEPGKKHRVRLDGFVPVDGRWRWFPRPYRVLPARSSTSGFWTE